MISTQNENVRLKEKILELENKLKGKNPFGKKFVRVVFKGYSNKEHDYLLGNHKNIKVGDIVLVGTKNGARQAQVAYISHSGEVSEYAKSPIIKKVR